MMLNGKASANALIKTEIDQLLKGDIVFLYKNEVGIVARGEADGVVKVEDDEGDIGEKHSMELLRFHHVKPPLTADEIKTITGTRPVFARTMYLIDMVSGKSIEGYIYKNGRA